MPLAPVRAKKKIIKKIIKNLRLSFPTVDFPSGFSTETLYEYNKNTLQITELEGLKECTKMQQNDTVTMYKI
jgi:hypothetical protein